MGAVVNVDLVVRIFAYWLLTVSALIVVLYFAGRIVLIVEERARRRYRRRDVDADIDNVVAFERQEIPDSPELIDWNGPA